MNDKRQEITAEQAEVEKAVLGIDAETFRRTKLGQYVFSVLEGTEEKLIEQLVHAALKSPDTAVLSIAMEIQMYRKLPKLVDEAIAAGRVAEDNIDKMESANIDY